MQIRLPLVSLLAVVLSLACSREQEPLTPIDDRGRPADGAEDRELANDPVKGSAPSSDPATDQPILARTSGASATGGVQSFDAAKAGSGGIGGFGLGGLAGGTPVSRP